jgi:hypothetical protein
MSGPHSVLRDNVVDGAKATPLLGMAAAWLGGISIHEWAAAAGLAYSAILIFDKLRQMGVFRWGGRQVARLRAFGGKV